jgi:hypothetical protein
MPSLSADPFFLFVFYACVVQTQLEVDLYSILADRDWEIQGLQSELSKTAAMLDSLHVSYVKWGEQN